jgi:hypothetical protein
VEKCQFLEMESRKRKRQALDSRYYERRRAKDLISCSTIEFWQDEEKIYKFTRTKPEKFD